MAYIIAADELKKSIPGYDPAHSEEVHQESARMADRAYEAALETSAMPTVILMAGGSASGKSEYVSEYLVQEDAIVLDGTLPTIEGATIKIKAALRAGKRVEVHLVLPGNLLYSQVVFMNRERKYALHYFYETHSRARATVLAIAQHFIDVSVRIVMSSVEGTTFGETMQFTEVEFSSRTEVIAYLHSIQYTEAQLRATINL